MHLVAYGLAGLVAVAIIFLGTRYVVSPWATASSFGLPSPADDAVTSSQGCPRYSGGVDRPRGHDLG